MTLAEVMLGLMLGLLGALLMMAVYWVGLQTRIFDSWVRGKEGPRERRRVFLVIAAVMGFIAGFMLHEPVQIGVDCHDLGQPIGKSMIATMLDRK